MAFKVGDRVQARVRNDRMFYTGTVTAVLPPDDPTSTARLKVEYDDDGETSTIPACWALHGEDRPVLWRAKQSDGDSDRGKSGAQVEAGKGKEADVRADGGGADGGSPPQTDGGAAGPAVEHRGDHGGGSGVLVTQSSMWAGNVKARELDANTGPRPARLLSFESSPKVYQSGVIVNEDGSHNWDHIFEPEQALGLSLALLSPALTMDGVDRRDVAVLGGGGGTLTMALHTLYRGRLRQDVVELDPDVITAGQEYFGLVKDDPAVTLYNCDALEFLKKAPDASYDVVLVDVCAHDAEDGAELELPSPPFVDETFLKGDVHRVLRSGGVFAMNVIGDALNLAKLTYKLQLIFGDVHILATDPNYYFYSRRTEGEPAGRTVVVSPEELVAKAEKAGLDRVGGDLLRHDVARTQHYREEETLIGWLGPTEFLDRCLKEVV